MFCAKPPWKLVCFSKAVDKSINPSRGLLLNSITIQKKEVGLTNKKIVKGLLKIGYYRFTAGDGFTKG